MRWRDPAAGRSFTTLMCEYDSCYCVAWESPTSPTDMLLCCTAQNAESLRCCRPAAFVAERQSNSAKIFQSFVCIADVKDSFRIGPPNELSRLCIFHNLGRWKVLGVLMMQGSGFSTGQLLYRVSALVFARHNTGNNL